MIHNDLAPWDYHALREALALSLPGLVHGESHHARRARRRAGQGRHGRIGELHRGRRRQAGLPGGTRHGPSAPRRPVRGWLERGAYTTHPNSAKATETLASSSPHETEHTTLRNGDTTM